MNRAFVLLGVAERKFVTLAAAVKAASGGDTIEIRGNGPFVTAPIDCGITRSTIRAGDGLPAGHQAQSEARAEWYHCSPTVGAGAGRTGVVGK